jgi:dihydropteroate synthase
LEPRPEFGLRWADGERLALGRRTAVMGVLNVTPDSFSDGGRHASLPAALAVAAAMVEAGADVIDVGGESTRPGAEAVGAAEELARVVPVIEAVKRELGARVSVDTRKAEVARGALDVGADLVNDVSALGDPGMLPLLSEYRVPAVLMHMRGTPETMQRNTRYGDLLGAVTGFLRERVALAAAAGLGNDKILVDPGLGFGKSAEGNLAILGRLHELRTLGHALLIGASRKSFLGALFGLQVNDRLEPSLAVAALAAAQGAHVVRAHDVAATVRVLRTVDAVREAVAAEMPVERA